MQYTDEIRTAEFCTSQALRNQFLVEPTPDPVRGGNPPIRHIINVANTHQVRPWHQVLLDDREEDTCRVYTPASIDGHQVPEDVARRRLYINPLLIDFLFGESERSREPHTLNKRDSLTIDRDAMEVISRPVSELDLSLIETNILHACGRTDIFQAVHARRISDTVRRIVLPGRFSEANTAVDRAALYHLSMMVSELPVYITR